MIKRAGSGSGSESVSVSQWYGPADPDPYAFESPGSVSFHYQAKVVRKTLISTVL
jgi:hypothetical protein